MFSTLRTRFGIPGVIAVIALVFAMFGGAYAASNSSGGGKATASAKAKKGPRGPKGAKGDTGPAGPVGPAGAKGDPGAGGANGKDGTNGTNGTNGVSPTGTAFSGNANGCTEGGVKIVGANTTSVCNGVKGAPGADGETGFTETLPPGKTETGAWAFGQAANDQLQFISISYNIPLEVAPEVHVIGENGLEKVFGAGIEEIEQPDCPGEVEEPLAEPGTACLYTKSETNVFFPQHPAFSNSFATGAVVGVLLTELTTGGNARGTWAVTAPEP